MGKIICQRCGKLVNQLFDVSYYTGIYKEVCKQCKGKHYINLRGKAFWDRETKHWATPTEKLRGLTDKEYWKMRKRIHEAEHPVWILGGGN